MKILYDKFHYYLVKTFNLNKKTANCEWNSISRVQLFIISVNHTNYFIGTKLILIKNTPIKLLSRNFIDF